MKTQTIEKKEAGQRLDKYLARILPKAPMSFFYKMLRKKNITLNHKKATGKELLQTGDVVELFLGEETLAKFSDSSMKKEARAEGYAEVFLKNEKRFTVEVVYEDEDILLLNKPVGMLSQKAAGQDFSLNEWLIGYLLKTKSISAQELSVFKPSVCNRIDRNTSGLVLCGKTLRGSRFLSVGLSSQKEEMAFSKFYLALVEGKVEEQGCMEGYQKKDRTENKVSFHINRTSEQAEYVKTLYRRLHYDEKKDISLVEAQLLTGKSHQIRVGFTFLGHPLMGDKKYGSKKGDGRYYLHAHRLKMPVLEGDWKEKYSNREFEAPLPAYFPKYHPDKEA